MGAGEKQPSAACFCLVCVCVCVSVCVCVCVTKTARAILNFSRGKGEQRNALLSASYIDVLACSDVYVQKQVHTHQTGG